MADHAAADGATERTRTLLETGRFREAAAVAARGLHEQPLNAQLWVHLAQALESTGNPAAAWAAFDRAWLLDPRAPWADSVSDRLGSHAGRPVPDWLSDLLQTPDIPLTGAVLARDEADSIAATLESIKPAVDRLIVIDTGSTDNTPDIARDAGAEVITVAWTDDFSAARNFGLSHILSGWVWWVDADEILDPGDILSPKRAIGLYDGSCPPAVLRVVLINDENRQNKNYDVARLFPVRYGMKFWGRIHEQIGPATGGVFAANYARPIVRIRLYHTGYRADTMAKKGKLARNLALLRKAVEENPDDIISWGFLGRELFIQGDLEQAVGILRHTENLAPRFPLYGRLAELRAYLAEALMQLGRAREAADVAQRAAADSPDFPVAWYELGRAQLMVAWQMAESARMAFLSARERAAGYRGDVSYDEDVGRWKASVGLGDIAKMQGNWVEAVSHYRAVLTVDPDNPKVRVPLQHMADQARAVQPLLAPLSVLAASAPPKNRVTPHRTRRHNRRK